MTTTDRVFDHCRGVYRLMWRHIDGNRHPRVPIFRQFKSTSKNYCRSNFTRSLSTGSGFKSETTVEELDSTFHIRERRLNGDWLPRLILTDAFEGGPP